MRILVLALVLLGVARAETYFEYQNPSAGFAVGYPKTWTASENARQTGVALFDSAYKGANKPVFSLSATKATPGVKLDDYDRLVPKLFTFLFDDYKQHLKQPTTLGGAPARMLLFEAKTAKSSVIGFLVYALKGGQLYTVGFFSARDDYDRYRQVSGNILGTFRFL